MLAFLLLFSTLSKTEIIILATVNPFQTTNFRLFQTERVCRWQKFDENGRKLSIRIENTVGKGEIAHYGQFLLFPQCFWKACFLGASKGVIMWEWVNCRLEKSWGNLSFLWFFPLYLWCIWKWLRKESYFRTGVKKHQPLGHVAKLSCFEASSPTAVKTYFPIFICYENIVGKRTVVCFKPNSNYCYRLCLGL